MILDTIDQARASAVRNAFRSSLTICGLVVGVMALGASWMLARGVGTGLWMELSELTENVIEIEWNAVEAGSGPFDRPPQQLDAGDVERLARIPGVSFVTAAVVRPRIKVRRDDLELGAGLECIPPIASETPGYQLAEGREFLPAEEAGLVGACYLGRQLAERMFPESSALGKTIFLNGAPFTVVGILAVKPDFFLRQFNYRAVVPMARVQEILPPIIGYDRITVRVADLAAMGAIAESVERVLEVQHGIRNYRVQVPREILDKQKRIFSGVMTVVMALAQISLAVSGIGVMNVLLFSVKERTREIGIRLTCGSAPADIFLIITLEALLLCAAGGLVGSACAYPVALLMAKGSAIFVPRGIRLQPVFSFGILAVSFVVALVTGALSGIYPSLVASRLEPAECLRTR